MSADVLRFFRGQRTDTAALLRTLLSRAERGDIKGLAVTFKTDAGFEESSFTGSYADSPADGVNAAMRLSWKLTQAQDALTKGPP
jgi:hypothetical protein